MGIVTDRKYVVRYIIYLCHLIILVVTLIFYQRGLMVYQQAVSLFCLRMINTEINGNSKSISSKRLFRDD